MQNTLACLYTVDTSCRLQSLDLIRQINQTAPSSAHSKLVIMQLLQSKDVLLQTLSPDSSESHLQNQLAKWQDLYRMAVQRLHDYQDPTPPERITPSDIRSIRSALQF